MSDLNKEPLDFARLARMAPFTSREDMQRDTITPKTQRQNRDRAKTRSLAALRQSVWEVSQFTTPPMIREYVEGVLREIESDGRTRIPLGFQAARAELERLQSQQEVIEKALEAPTMRGEAIRVVLAEYDALKARYEALRDG